MRAYITVNQTCAESWSICFSAVLKWIMHDIGRKSVVTVLILLAVPLSWPNTLCSLTPFTEELFPAQEPIPVCDILYLKKKNHANHYRHFFPKLILFHDKSTLSILWSPHIFSETVSTQPVKEALGMNFSGNESISIYNYIGFRNQTWISGYPIPSGLLYGLHTFGISITGFLSSKKLCSIVVL